MSPRRPRSLLQVKFSALAIAAAFLFLSSGNASAARPPQKKAPAKSPATQKAPPAKPKKKPGAPATAAPAPERVLEQLARALHDSGAAKSYSQLSKFASQHPNDEWGLRASLALGYFDWNRSHFSDAQRWLERAARVPAVLRDSPLREYVLYWRAQADRLSSNRVPQALEELDAFRRELPASVMTEQVLDALAQTALQLNQPGRALSALNLYDKASARPVLLLRRAQLLEKTGQSGAAAKDYIAVAYGFPLSSEAESAAARLPALEKQLGNEFPIVTAEQLLARGDALFDARHWRDARAEYQKLLPALRRKNAAAGVDRAQVRIARCSVEMNASPGLLASLEVPSQDADAERLYALSQAYRSHKQEPEMLAAIGQVVAHYPQSRWAEDALFAAGNYLWVNLDRKRAAEYYRRMLQSFPDGKNTLQATWRIAWAAYLERRPDTAQLLEAHVRQFPNSQYVVNSLYWLGRVAEREGNAPRARSLYLKARERWPQTYYGEQATQRIRELGPAPAERVEIVENLPPAPAVPSLEDPVPPAAAGRWARAQALRMIAFDASAELELRAGYAETSSPRLLWEAARAAFDADRFPQAIATARQLYPQLEARKFGEVPREVWRVVYPLPYEESLRRAAAKQDVDPMLVAGLIRQESVFQAEAVSHAGAVGLMQVLPKTGKLLARRLRLGYSRARLLKPEYNLQLGTLYLSDLLREMGSPEAALAAFNAGEDRVALWKADRAYAEQAEFVESIPFTETREYVQIVLRNAALYRQLYPRTTTAQR